ncbi:alanyl-tRNA synthetase [Actinomadura pelletieri DSM 43383]|uniref:Alanine--tRNA ligase n=1 Tax=Actinomadura pelletieri DSM 43383 TaxID=1120940 RepID=A0A495QV14_9ACTN|nr:alanine--tRNA ligase [Actinomadura pelletieri]RKS77281.1 alanyl-tRNA synthetase [Actinomadura pelletieri DSM 43383]
MRSTDIRSTFLDFFQQRDHRVVPSSPLIPSDPTLLLTNAGMNQFKPYFLGETKPDHSRAVSVQKCARTSDIENVGRTTRHSTFFEMLGNFSFGDYFKADAIAWAWELLTRHYNLEPERLWITVYVDDDESVGLWKRIGVPSERIQRLGMEDNYWSMGVPGPCGPSSEIHYDRGPSFGREGGPAVDGERYQELWNLVFMQNLRGEGPGKDEYPILGELPARNIDTGLGLGRLAAILQNVDTECETDLLAPTFRLVREMAGRDDTSTRIVTEHARSIAFLIADGVLPSRDGRGYVLRRLMRRAIRHARKLGMDDLVLAPLTSTVIENQGPTWPELTHHADLIQQVVTAEEQSFERTLRQGSQLLESAIEKTTTTLSGHTAFVLHDTYGFPIDLTIDAARSAGLTVDENEFAELLEKQRLQAQHTSRGHKNNTIARQDTYRRITAEHGPTDFVGHSTTTTETTILTILGPDGPLPDVTEGMEIEVVLSRTPFYAESGGQVGDTGTLRTSDATLQVLDTRLGLDGLHVHTARVLDGEARPGDAEAIVDADRRAATARSHSATHVLHAMLRRLLGDHATQRGSRVEPGRLRFDFAHFSPVDTAVVQTLVNDYLLDDPEVRVWETSRTEAEEAGALTLFGEKYGDTVRVVDIGDASRELCGGTHVGHGTQAGPVHIVSEQSIGTGLRRIEALIGADALRHYDHQRDLLTELAALLHVTPDEAPHRLRQRLETLAETQRHLETLHRTQLNAHATRLASHAEQVPGGWLVADTVPHMTATDLRTIATTILTHRGQDGIVILGTESGGKAILVAAGGPHVQARDLLTTAAREVGGGAGGKGPIANAGGRNPGNLPKAINTAATAARALLAPSH